MMNGNVGIRLRSPNCGDEPHSQSPSLPPLPDLIPIKKSAVNGKSRPFRNIKNTIGKKEPIDPFISYKDQRTSNTVTSNIVNSRNCNSCDATNLSSNSLLDGEYRWFSQLETIDDKIKIHEDENCNTELLESSSSVKKELSESYQDNSNSSSSSVNRCNGTKSRSESDNWSSMEDHKPTTFTSTIRLRKLPERIRLSAEAKLADRTARNRVHTQPFQSKPNEQSKLRRTKKDSTSSSKSTQPVLSNTNGNTDVSAVPRVNPIFLFVKQENTRIVDVRCEDYDKRNRIRLTKTESGWKAIPHINSNKTDRNALKIKHKKHKKCKKRFRSPSNNNNEAFNQNLTVTKSTGNHHQRSHHQEADNYGMGNTIYTTCSVDRQSIDESLLIRPRNKSTEKHKKKKKKKLKKCKTIHIKNENDIWRESGSTQSSLSNTSSPCFLIKDESGGLESSRYDSIKVKTHALIKKTTDEPEHPIHSDCQGDGNSLVSFLKEQYHQPNKQDQHHICNGNEEVERKIESRNVVEMHSSEKEDNNIIPTIENNHLNHSQQHNRVWQEQRRNATAPNALSCNITPTIEKIPGQELPAPNLSDNATTSTATGIKNENLINFLDSDCKIEYSDNLEQSEQYDINKLDNSSVLVGRVKEEYQVKPIQQIEHSENLGLFGYDNKMNVSGDNLCSTSALMAVTDKVATTLASNASIAVTQTSSVMVSSTPSGHHHHQQQQQQSNCIEFDGPNGVPTSSHIPDDYNEDDDIMLAAQPVADIISRLDDSSSTSCKELSLDGVSDIDHIVDPKLFDASGTVLNPDMISKTLSQLNQSMLDELSDTFKKFEKPETINSDDKMTTADELEQLQLDALEQRDTDTPRDLSCKKSEVPASKQTLMQSPRRPVSHSSDTIQSPQPSGLPAISLSPDIGLQYRNKSLSFTDLLSSSSSSSKVIDLADDICNKHIDSTNRINPTDYLKPPPVQNRGPIDLGKNRKSASPTVSCSEEVKYSKPNTQTGQSNQPLRSPNDDTICKSAYDMRRINSSQVTQSLPIDKDPDALTQFRLLTSNPEWKVPDPLVVPKDRLKAVLASPAREIPLLLMTRPELRLPEAFSFPRILQDPDILVISLQTLEAMLQKEQDQEFHKRQIPLSVNTSQSSSRPKSTSSEASSKPESLTSPDPKDRSPTGNSLACDIDSATMAAFHQMLLLPYLAARKNEYNPDLIKFMTELSNIGMANASLLSALKGNKEMESSNNIMQNVLPHTNPLEFAMWQQALANTNLAQLMKLNAERETREKKQQMQSSSSKSAQLADALNKPNRSLPMAYQLNLLQQQQHQQQQQQHQAAQLQAQQQQLLQQQLFQQQQQQQQHHQHQQQQKQQQAQAQAQQQQQQRINSMMNPFLMSPLFGGNLQNTPNMNSRGSQNMQSHQKSSPVATNPLSVENLTQLNPAWCRLDQNYMKNQRQLASAASASGKVDQQQALNNFHLLNRLHSEQMAGSSMNDKRQNSRPLTPPPQPTEEPKGRLTCKSLKNLLEPELLRNEMKEQTSKRRKLNEMPDYPPNPFMNPMQSVMGSNQRTKSKNSKSNIPMDPLMAHRQYMNPMLGMHDVRSAATNLGKMNEFMQQNPMAFHPFYNSPKPYNTPWEWNTVSAAGE